jgi:glycosyltransferase involved in cell wall biosynthesis
MKKIAVMLPIPYKGGSLRAAKNMAKSIAYQARQRGDDIQVVFSYVRNDNYNIYSDFSDLTKANIALRETQWKAFSKESLQAAAALLEINNDVLEFDEFCLPVDGANDFNDCDLWIIISDRLPAPLFPLKKNAFVVFDYIQRYVPEIFGDSEELWNNQVACFMASLRNSAKVFVTTPSTQQDLISYAGVEEHRTHLLELDFQLPNFVETAKNVNIPENYILWTTNAAYHKNHINALKGYEIYLQEYGGINHLVITGVDTEVFDPKFDLEKDSPFLNCVHINKIRDKLEKNKILADHIHIMGNISDRIYMSVLKNAHYLWHPALYDNGTFSVLEAAYLGVPSLSAHYPAMAYFNQKFNLNLKFFNPRNPVEIADALKEMETSAKSIALPPKEALAQSGWENLSAPLYNEITSLLN